MDEYNGVKRERDSATGHRGGRKQYYLLRSKAEIYLRQNIAGTNLFWTMLTVSHESASLEGGCI